MIDPSSSPVPACPQCAQLLERIVELEALVRDLQGRLNRNSSNSSIPPPANPLDAPKPVVKAPSGRKPGGQSGHPGRHRHRLPPERVKNIVPYVPTVRTQCRAPLPAEPGLGDPDPSRHQVAELPELAEVITEHPGHARTCPRCGYLLEQGRSRADSKAATSCVNLLALYPALWLFAAVEGVEPTNNHAKRIQRLSMPWRKNAFGCQSAAGCRFVERMLTVVQSPRLQIDDTELVFPQFVTTTYSPKPLPLSTKRVIVDPYHSSLTGQNITGLCDTARKLLKTWLRMHAAA